MAFTMSYGITPSPAPTETPQEAAAPKKSAPRRARKLGSLQTQAQALFDPALARPSEAPPHHAATDMSEDEAAVQKSS